MRVKVNISRPRTRIPRGRARGQFSVGDLGRAAEAPDLNMISDQFEFADQELGMLQEALDTGQLDVGGVDTSLVTEPTDGFDLAPQSFDSGDQYSRGHDASICRCWRADPDID